MALEYSIYDESSELFYELTIPFGNYYKTEGYFLNNTVCNNWRGYNDESFSWIRTNNCFELNKDDEIILVMTLNEYSLLLKNLKENYQNFNKSKEIISILELLLLNKTNRVDIYFD